MQYNLNHEGERAQNMQLNEDLENQGDEQIITRDAIEKPHR